METPTLDRLLAWIEQHRFCMDTHLTESELELTKLKALAALGEAALRLCAHTKTLADVPEKQRTSACPVMVMREWEDERSQLVADLHSEAARYNAITKDGGK